MYLYEKIALEKAENEKLMKIYEKNVDVKEENKRYVALMGSMSHTYGNALAYMQNWVINIFPENMFKTIHVNSKIAHRQIRSTTHEFLKKSKPMIVFRPRIAGHDEDRFLKGTPLIERQNDIYSTHGSTAFQPFFEDPNHDLSIKYQMNRSVMYVDVVVILSTLMQQLDYYHYLENAVRIDHPFNLNTYFESYIPQDMLKIIGDCVDLPLYDEEGSTKDFLTYMNQNSIYPITYKLQGSSGSKEFYRYYPVTIDTRITDLDKDEGDRVGQVMSQYQISFSVRMEFNTTGFYYLYSDNIYKINLPEVYPENSDVIPVFTDVILKEDLNLQMGWHLYNRASYRLETEDDVVEFDSMINSSIRESIDYHIKNGLPVFDFIDIKIRKQGKLIHAGNDYDIDFEKRQIRLHSQNTYYTYTILVCINIEYINNLMKTIYKLDDINK